MTLNGEMALVLYYFLLNLVISVAYCVKVASYRFDKKYMSF